MRRYYGKTPLRPEGHPEDRERCAASVYNGLFFYQCKNQRGHGKKKLLCRQHAKMQANPVAGLVWIPKEEPEP